MFEVVSAVGFTNEQLREAMQDAFSDYAIPLKLSASSFEVMTRQRGLDLPSSRVALIEGEVAAIWLTAVRGTKSYLISSGTRPVFRSRGLARAMAVDCLAGLKAIGVRSFQTEVLRINETAAKLYYSLGMTQTRSLDCYEIPEQSEAVVVADTLERVDWPNIRERVGELRDWEPSWQNDDLSLDAIAGHLLCLTLADAAGLVGFVVATEKTGTVHQFAIRKDARRAGVGSALVGAARRHLAGKPLRFINVQQDDAVFRRLMNHVGAEAIEGQYELKMDL